MNGQWKDMTVASEFIEEAIVGIRETTSQHLYAVVTVQIVIQTTLVSELHFILSQLRIKIKNFKICIRLEKICNMETGGLVFIFPSPGA